MMKINNPQRKEIANAIRRNFENSLADNIDFPYSMWIKPDRHWLPNRRNFLGILTRCDSMRFICGFSGNNQKTWLE